MKVYSLFLISSGYVWSALLEFKKNSPPAILYSESLPLSQNENPDKNKLEKDILNSTALAAANLAIVSKEKKLSLEGNIVVLAAPWYVGKTKIVTQSYKRNTAIKQEVIDDLIKEQINKFENENDLRGAATLENKITNVTLNGYSTTSPLNKKASSLAFSLFFSLTTKNLKTSLDEIFEKDLHFSSQQWHSMPVFLFGSLINQLGVTDQPKDFLILDVGAEVSEISIVRRNTFLETASMPFGSNHVVRAVAEGFKMTIPLASSLLRLQTEGGANEINAISLKEVFSSQESILKGLLLPSLVNLSAGLSLPPTVYLICDEYTKTFFKQILEEEDYSASALIGSKFNVIEIDFKIFCNSLLLNI